ncbi:MAG TPA: hypothetical protein VGG75_12085 [Trebonia sp.]
MCRGSAAQQVSLLAGPDGGLSRRGRLRGPPGGDDAGVPITSVHVNEAKERVIRDRAPHLDSLAARLREPRVQRVIEPLIAGDDLPPLDAAYDDDVSYVEDLGLISTGVDVEVANPSIARSSSGC